MEAIAQSISLNYKFLEIDMQLSADGKMICIHDWKEWMQMAGIDEKEGYIPDETVFLETELYGHYKAISFVDIMYFLSNHKDVMIILDTKEVDPEIVIKQYTYIFNTLKENDMEDIIKQFIIPVYTKGMYVELTGILGDNVNYYYSTYMSSDWDGSIVGLRTVCEWIKEETNIKLFEMSKNIVSEEVCEVLHEYELDSMVFTVNDIKDVQRYFQMGVDYVETDYVRPEDVK